MNARSSRSEKPVMADEPILKLNLVDVYGVPLGEQVNIILRHQTLSDVVKVTEVINGPIQIRGLNGAPQGLYKIEIDPPSYRPVAQFINLGSSGTTSLKMAFSVQPNKIVSVTFPAFASLARDLRQLLEASSNVTGFGSLKGKLLYNAICGDTPRAAGLLNIAAKTQSTVLSNGKTVLSTITELIEIRGDRFFAIVPQQLRDDTKNSIADGLFHEVDSLLHHPPNGYEHAGSYKSSDRYGNLQLTFFAGKDNWMADIDIDEAAGIEHVFQVLHNALPNESTNPYDIHEILLGYQQIDPGYSLNV